MYKYLARKSRLDSRFSLLLLHVCRSSVVLGLLETPLLSLLVPHSHTQGQQQHDHPRTHQDEGHRWRFIFPASTVTGSSPELLLLLLDPSAGTTLHTIITIPRAMSPTPRAHRAYWEPEFPVFSLLILLWGLMAGPPLPRRLGGVSKLERMLSVPKLQSDRLQRGQKLLRERNLILDTMT